LSLFTCSFREAKLELGGLKTLNGILKQSIGIEERDNSMPMRRELITS